MFGGGGGQKARAGTTDGSIQSGCSDMDISHFRARRRQLQRGRSTYHARAAEGRDGGVPMTMHWPQSPDHKPPHPCKASIQHTHRVFTDQTYIACITREASGVGGGGGRTTLAVPYQPVWCFIIERATASTKGGACVGGGGGGGGAPLNLYRARHTVNK